MKITKRQLRRIIREEKQRLMNENVPPFNHSPAKDAYDDMAHARSDGDIKKFTRNLERLIEFGGQDFDDVQIKAAVASALRNLGIK